MESGMVKVDSPFARSIGFTSDKFSGWGWIKKKEYYVSCIASKDEGKGNFRAMIHALLNKGYTVKVPTPFARMKMIVKRLGFQQILEADKAIGETCEVWVKKP